MKQHLAIYGNTKIVRGYCYRCSRYALVVGGLLQCCDRQVEAEPTKIRRMSQPEAVRRTPSASAKRQILESQDYRCLYCDVSLDGYVFYRSEMRRVRTTWDHMMPYAHSLNNHDVNFAATCQFCNAWKSSLIFKTVEEVRIYVAAKWEAERKSKEDMRRVRNEVRAKTMVAEVLQTDMSVSSVESSASTAD